jgi:hypothetical protein
MKCALEMEIEIAKVEELERIKAEEERKAKYQAKLAEFYEELERFDEKVENALLEGKGKAEFLIDNSRSYKEEGDFYYLAEPDNFYAYKNGGHPYYCMARHSCDFPLEIYVDYLKSHCYNVEITDYSFIGYSSTGATSRTVKCKKMKISI